MESSLRVAASQEPAPPEEAIFVASPIRPEIEMEIDVATADQTRRPSGTTGRFVSKDTIRPVVLAGKSLPIRWK